MQSTDRPGGPVFCYPPPKKKKRKTQNIISSTHTSRKQFLQPTDGNSQAQDPWGKSPQLTRLTNTPASPAIRRTIVRSVALLSAKCYLPTATCPAILQFNNPFPFQRLPQKYSIQNGAKNNKKKNETNKAKYFKLEFAFEQALKKKKKMANNLLLWQNEKSRETLFDFSRSAHQKRKSRFPPAIFCLVCIRICVTW